MWLLPLRVHLQLKVMDEGEEEEQEQEEEQEEPPPQSQPPQPPPPPPPPPQQQQQQRSRRSHSISRSSRKGMIHLQPESTGDMGLEHELWDGLVLGRVRKRLRTFEGCRRRCQTPPGWCQCRRNRRDDIQVEQTGCCCSCSSSSCRSRLLLSATGCCSAVEGGFRVECEPFLSHSRLFQLIEPGPRGTLHGRVRGGASVSG